MGTAVEKDLWEVGLKDVENNSWVQIYKKRYIKLTLFGPRFTTFIKLIPSKSAEACFEQGKLYRCQIQTSSGLSLSRAFNFQLNRVKNRWNVAIKRTTGFVILDTIGTAFLAIVTAVRAALRIIFGTRVKLRDLTKGAEFMSRTIEEQKETETMIFASLAAIIKASEFAGEGSAEITYLGRDYMKEVSGLTFAGGMDGTMGMMAASGDDDSDDTDDTDEEDEIELDEMEMGA